MKKLLITTCLVCLAGCSTNQPETKTVTVTAKEANEMATNAPNDPQKAMESFQSQIDQSTMMKKLIKGISLQPNSDMLQIEVYPNAWNSFDKPEKEKLAKDFQYIWALSNAPADSNKCPIRIVDTDGSAVGGSKLPDGAVTWAQ